MTHIPIKLHQFMISRCFRFCKNSLIHWKTHRRTRLKQYRAGAQGNKKLKQHNHRSIDIEYYEM